jgi:hypothetical protein
LHTTNANENLFEKTAVMRVPVEAALNVGVDSLVLVAGRAKVYHLKQEMTELLLFYFL